MSNINNRQRGVSLIESLVAIVVTALGILGILGVQLRTLADTQTGVRRAQAIRLIEDLSEHTKVNPNALGNFNSYLMNWGATPTAPVDCKITPCNPQQLALYDASRWRQAVTNALPNSDVNVFIVPDETVANKRCFPNYKHRNRQCFLPGKQHLPSSIHSTDSPLRALHNGRPDLATDFLPWSLNNEK